jgi:hypothetical protein
MANTIQIKRSSTSGSAPTAGQLAQGELAVNLADEALYTKDASNAVVKLNAPSIDDKNTGATKHVSIAASGNVGIGTSSPANKLSIGAGSFASATAQTTGMYTNGTNGLVVLSDAYSFNSRTGTGFATIDSSGNLLVGLTSPFGGFSGSLQVANANTGQIVVRNTSATAGQFFRIGPDGASNNLVIANHNGTGVFLANGATSWTGLSDERLKTDFQPIENAAEKVSQLRAVTGRFKTDEEDVRRVFLIAQDVQVVLPEAVDVGDDEQNTLGIRYTDTIPLLVAAIQEQQAIITALTARVEALEAV